MTSEPDTYADAFLRPWNERDIDAALTAMTPEPEWEFTVGSDPWGTRLVGPEAIRSQMEKLYAAIPDLSYELVRTFAGDDFLVMEVRVTGTRDGQELDYQACDILTFDGGLVAAKRSYRKVVS